MAQTARSAPIPRTIVVNNKAREPSGAMIVGAAFVTIFLFALSPITTRLLASDLDGLSLALLRVMAVAPIAATVICVRRLAPPAGAKALSLLAFQTAGAFIGFPILFSLGTARTSAVHASLCMATIPLFTAAIGLAIERRRPEIGFLLGAGVAIVGEVFVVLSRSIGGLHEPTIIGDTLVLASCLSAACGFIAGGRLASVLDTWTATFWGLLAGSVCLAPLLLTPIAHIPWSSMNAFDWLAVLHLTAGIAIGYSTWFFALAHGDVARIASLQFLQPILSVAYAAMLLSEPVALPTVIAGIVIIGGVAIAQGRIPLKALLPNRSRMLLEATPPSTSKT
jgi:drug/metabolite transporter (DMT)-like permease